MTRSKNFAIVGAGMAGITCARTLMQAGHTVTVFEKSAAAGGRMATRNSPFGTFDHGARPALCASAGAHACVMPPLECQYRAGSRFARIGCRRGLAGA